jgi:glycosyltransferase involved in cell wall biosynthesis
MRIDYLAWSKIAVLKKSMKILQLVNRVPYPLNDGGNIGVHYYTQGLLEAGVSLSMLAMNTTRHWVDRDQLPDLFSRLDYFETVRVDNRIRVIPALQNLFQKSSYHIDRFISRDYEKALIALLQQQEFDIIQLESLFLTPYVALIRKYSKAQVVIRQHNVEFKIWERLAEKEKNPFRKWYLNLLTRRLKAFELTHLNDYDLLLPISGVDARLLEHLGCKKPIFIHPFGIDTDTIPYLPAATAPMSLYHIGSMDWLPNQEGIHYFLEQIMPKITKALPDLQLYLAGRNMPAYYFTNHWKNVVVLGEVADALAFERDKSVLVVPLLSGGGVRIKIFQAMAMGKTVITTSVGAEGIEARPGEELIIAETPQDFVSAIRGLAAQPERLQTIGAAARHLMETRYNRKKLMTALLERYAQLCSE